METNLSSSEDINEYFKTNEFLYIIYSEYGCKIGISRDPSQRFEQIEQGLPSQKAILIGLYRGQNCSDYEKKLHQMLKERKISGEWFILNQYHLDEINQFLIKNNFTCILKISILWANYLIPSIYLNGRVQIIETERKIKSLAVRNQKLPEIVKEILIKPTETEIVTNNCEFLTATQISVRLREWDLVYTPTVVGQYLQSVGFKSKSKRIAGIGVRHVYPIKIKKINSMNISD